MIFTLTPAAELYNKILGDFHLTSKDIDMPDFTRWCMEAAHHIGGLHRCPTLLVTEIIPLNNGTALLKATTQDVRDVGFNSSLIATEADKFPRIRRVTGPLDHSDTEVVFRYAPLSPRPGIRQVPALTVNRVTGSLMIETSELPFLLNENEAYIISSPTYEEAVMWYIIYKMQTYAFFKNPGGKSAQMNEAKAMWNGMRNAAYGELMMCDKWELDELADILSLGVSYTGLKKRRIMLPSGEVIDVNKRSRTGLGGMDMDKKWDPNIPVFEPK